MASRRRADRAPHRLAARTPAALLVPALVRNLAEVVDGTAVYVEPTGAVIASWPPLPPGRVLGEDLAAVAALPGMSGVEPVSGGGGVLVSAPRWTSATGPCGARPPRGWAWRPGWTGCAPTGTGPPPRRPPVCGPARARTGQARVRT
ncbi:hypothetical protein K7G98_11155 [Saccharothrix sp. MB29]|nr:hypothetical protein [Saccharothrix sp. MB29]